MYQKYLKKGRGADDEEWTVFVGCIVGTRGCSPGTAGSFGNV